MTELERLIELAYSLGLADDSLDEEVYDCIIDVDRLNSVASSTSECLLDEMQQEGSDINNGGFEEQIEFLLQHNDASLVEELIRDAAE